MVSILKENAKIFAYIKKKYYLRTPPNWGILAAKAQLLPQFSPEITFALSCKLQAFIHKNHAYASTD